MDSEDERRGKGYELNRQIMGRRFPEDDLDREMADPALPFVPTPEQWAEANRISEESVGTGMYLSPAKVLGAMVPPDDVLAKYGLLVRS